MTQMIPSESSWPMCSLHQKNYIEAKLSVGFSFRRFTQAPRNGIYKQDFMSNSIRFQGLCNQVNEIRQFDSNLRHQQVSTLTTLLTGYLDFWFTTSIQNDLLLLKIYQYIQLRNGQILWVSLHQILPYFNSVCVEFRACLTNGNISHLYPRTWGEMGLFTCLLVHKICWKVIMSFFKPFEV